MATSEARPFFGGVPTKPDVDLLWEHVPAEPGEDVSYTELEVLLHLERHVSRFRTVLDAWRTRLFHERNIDTTATGKGIRFLLPDERVDASMRDLLRGIRKIGRGNRRSLAIKTHELSVPYLRKHDHSRMLYSKMTEVALQVKKEIAPPKATEARPQLGPTTVLQTV